MNNLDITQLDQILYILEWLFISGVTTFIFWVWLRRWFKNKIWDQGWIISKMVGLLAFPYIIWLLSHLPFFSLRQHSLPLFAIIMISLVFIYWYREKLEWFSWPVFKKIIFLEVLFLIPFVFTLFYKGFNPQILGTEKLMDVAFINSIARSDNMPPVNPWLSVATINYYYFGQLVVAVWSKISLIPIRIFYNIWIAFIGAISIQIVFLILRSIIKSVRWSVIGAMSIIFAGNIHYAYLIVKQYRAGLAIKDLDYFFANSTRLIGNTINEFPLYSIVLGDLHAHFLDLPLFLLFILGIINLFKDNSFIGKKTFLMKKPFKDKKQWYQFFKKIICKEKERTQKRILENVGWLILLAWLLGMMYMTNLWDTLTGVLLLSMTLLITWLRGMRRLNLGLKFSKIVNHQKKKNFVSKFWYLLIRNNWQGLVEWQKFFLSLLTPAVVLGVVGTGSLLVAFPFMLNFSAPVGGVGRVAADQVSDLPNWLFYWGGWVGIIMLSVWAFIKMHVKQLLISKYKVVGLFLVWLIIISLTEVFYVKDVFSWANHDYARTNTVFKIYYEGWLLVGIVAIVGAYAVNVNVWQQIKKIKIYPRKLKQYLVMMVSLVPLLLIGVILLSMFLYTYKSFNQFYPQVYQEINDKKSLFKKWNLDGYQFLKDTHQADYQAIKYLQKNISPQKKVVVLEAVKGQSSYTYFARIASYTGIPTILGWPFHIVQWHGGYKTDVADVVQIEDDVTIIYTATNSLLIKKMLKKYQIKYIYIGEQEYLLYEQELNKTINLSFYKRNCSLIYKDEVKTYLFKCF